MENATPQTITFSNGTYVGDVIDGKRTGKGTYTWNNGNKYEGDYVDGKRTGIGTFTWANGDSYVGDFKDNRRTGHGKFISASGEVQEGEFVDGKFVGPESNSLTVAVTPGEIVAENRNSSIEKDDRIVSEITETQSDSITEATIPNNIKTDEPVNIEQVVEKPEITDKSARKAIKKKARRRVAIALLITAIIVAVSALALAVSSFLIKAPERVYKTVVVEKAEPDEEAVTLKETTVEEDATAAVEPESNEPATPTDEPEMEMVEENSEAIETAETEVEAEVDSTDYNTNNTVAMKSIEIPEQIKTAEVGDIITFGTYEQDNVGLNGQEEIDWIVLAREDDRILVISEYALDCRPFNSTWEDTKWADCSLRTWLNDTFLNRAFTEDEQALIFETSVTADANPSYGTDPGNDAVDKVFLLSVDELEEYFWVAGDRMCLPTEYALAQGAHESDEYYITGQPTCFWWLRTPGNGKCTAAFVCDDGVISLIGNSICSIYDCVRPALWLRTSAENEEVSEEAESDLSGELITGAPLGKKIKVSDVSASSELFSSGNVKYYAKYAVDGKTDTCWQYSSDDNAKSITIYFEDTQNISSIAFNMGFQSHDYYYHNNRPKTVTITFSNGEEITAVFDDIETTQTICFTEAIQANSFKVSIVDVYQGDLYSDTCISEITPYE